MKKVLNAIITVFRKIYGNKIILALIFLWGLCFSVVNIIEFALFTVFLVLGTVDSYTECFSHGKIYNKWLYRIGMTGFFVLILYSWWLIFSGKNHHNISLTNVPLWEWHNALCSFVYMVILGFGIILVLYIVVYALKKLWDYLNRWQQ